MFLDQNENVERLRDGRNLLLVAALIAMPDHFHCHDGSTVYILSIHPRRVAGSIASWSGQMSICLKRASSALTVALTRTSSDAATHPRCASVVKLNILQY